MINYQFINCIIANNVINLLVNPYSIEKKVSIFINLITAILIPFSCKKYFINMSHTICVNNDYLNNASRIFFHIFR